MKKMPVLLITASLLFSASAFADDPCETALCLWGKLQNGAAPVGCSDAEKAFFSKIAKKHGSFLPNHTFDMRKQFLYGCPANTVPREFLDKILNRFGRQLHG
jgi:hypothetical protein